MVLNVKNKMVFSGVTIMLPAPQKNVCEDTFNKVFLSLSIGGVGEPGSIDALFHKYNLFSSYENGHHYNGFIQYFPIVTYKDVMSNGWMECYVVNFTMGIEELGKHTREFLKAYYKEFMNDEYQEENDASFTPTQVAPQAPKMDFSFSGYDAMVSAAYMEIKRLYQEDPITTQMGILKYAHITISSIDDINESDFNARWAPDLCDLCGLVECINKMPKNYKIVDRRGGKVLAFSISIKSVGAFYNDALICVLHPFGDRVDCTCEMGCEIANGAWGGNDRHMRDYVNLNPTITNDSFELLQGGIGVQLFWCGDNIEDANEIIATGDITACLGDWELDGWLLSNNDNKPRFIGFDKINRDFEWEDIEDDVYKMLPLLNLK